jgi:mannose-6-phosphate isomerase-like protein (cupin superfamily)
MGKNKFDHELIEEYKKAYLVANDKELKDTIEYDKNGYYIFNNNEHYTIAYPEDIKHRTKLLLERKERVKDQDKERQVIIANRLSNLKTSLSPQEWEDMHTDAEWPSCGLYGGKFPENREKDTQVQLNLLSQYVISLSSEIWRLRMTYGEEVWIPTWMTDEELAKERHKYELQLMEERPWGRYKIISNGEGFKAKEIVVNPNSRTSLQRHFKRSEFWTIVGGIGKVYIGYKTSAIMDYLAKPGLSYNVPCGAIHRIENNSNQDLVLIEVQAGNYLEEDDIERIEDDYGRIKKDYQI